MVIYAWYGGDVSLLISDETFVPVMIDMANYRKLLGPAEFWILVCCFNKFDGRKFVVYIIRSSFCASKFFLLARC